MSEPSEHVKQPWLAFFAALLLAWGLALLVFLYWTWRTAEAARDAIDAAGNDVAIEVSLLGWHFSATAETALLLLVIGTAAVGSYVHAATSFVSFVGNQRLRRSWLAWYAFRSFIGASLAIVFYLVVRAGFLSGTSGAEDVSFFGIAALSGLSGMFSKQATDKLREVFDTVFASGGDDGRVDKLDPLTLASITPSSLPVGSGPERVVLRGSGFMADAVVLVRGEPRTPIELSGDEIQLELSPADLGQAGTITFAIRSPTGDTSNPLELTITS